MTLNPEQQTATHPRKSVWVSASAGTGKTKVLIDRTLRLLLNHVSPDKILCITFTNAAANEMLIRIRSELLKWHKMSKGELAEGLLHLLGAPATTEQLDIAANLFTKLNQDGCQLNIQTIHAFCQSILARFPVEAGINSHAKIIDEVEQTKILRNILSDIFLHHNNETIDYFLGNFHPLKLEELIANILNAAPKFRYFFETYASDEEYAGQLAKLLALKASDNKDYLRQSTIAKLKKLADSSEDSKLHPLYELLQQSEPNYLTDILPIFLTKTGGMRTRLVAKSIVNLAPELEEVLRAMQLIVHQTEQEIQKLDTYQYTLKLIGFARALLERYERYKQEHALLDYDDLIQKTAKFLHNNSFREWVLYKLEGGIEHILVDEAQDTSELQWLIIESLISELYSGAGSTSERSLFVVGDAKQSIYSFQGANVNSYARVKEAIGSSLKAGMVPFEYVELPTSYRSSAAVLNLVEKIFQNIASIEYGSISCHRENAEGKVILWNFPAKIGNKTEKQFWAPYFQDETTNRTIIIARKIASYINQQVESKTVLSSTGKPAEYGDFLILVRKRGLASQILATELAKCGVEIAGIDRLSLTESKIINSLLLLSKFVLQPLEDANLAELLLSPLIALAANELDLLLNTKPANISLWQHLQINSVPYAQELEYLIRLYKHQDLYSFFEHVLYILDYRSRLLLNLTEEGPEIIEYFFNILRQHIEHYGSNMQQLVWWLQHNELEIKRDLSKTNKVKIMTVHGAKGLEAPIVIMPETNDLPRNNKYFILEDKLCIAARYKKSQCQFYEDVAAEIKEEEYKEYLRLLYVAITRAQDSLVICGYEENKKQEFASWHQLLSPYVEQVEQIAAAEVETLLAQTNNDALVNYIPPDSYFCPSDKLLPANDKTATVNYIPPDSYFCPSDKLLPANDKTATESNYSAILYGKAMHQLLVDAILTEGKIDLSSHPILSSLLPKQQKHILIQTEKIIESEWFLGLKNYSVRSEVSIGSKSDNGLVGRIDLLLENKEEIIIVDFKTDKILPKDIESINISYRQQMAFYHSKISALYKESKQIISQIFWTEHLVCTTLLESK